MSVVERWRDVVGYSGYYEVSNLGRVRSVDRVITFLRKNTKVTKSLKGKIIRLKPCSRKEYLMVNLSKNGVMSNPLVHRVVAFAWIGPPPAPNYEVCHNNGKATDNNVDNLRWGTSTDNKLDTVKHGTWRNGHSN